MIEAPRIDPILYQIVDLKNLKSMSPRRILMEDHKELKYEMETCEDFESKTLPTLDYQCWLEEGKLL